MNVSSLWSSDGLSTHGDILSLTSSPFKPAFYHLAKADLIPGVSDKYVSLILPIIVYWLVSAWFALLDYMRLPLTEKYRLHEPEEVTARNRVGPLKVAVMVFIQQVLQTGVGMAVLEGDAVGLAEVFADHEAKVRALAGRITPPVLSLLGPDRGVKFLHLAGPGIVHFLYWWGIPIVQFWFAFFIMDAWQYGLHRLFHESRFLYRHFHSHHHRLYVPYAFGALYNHPVEGLLLDSAGGALAHACALMTVRQAVLFFTFSTLKTVCDHGGYAFPPWLDPLHLVFPNCAEYHDVHHQMSGLRFNYSQPFFVHFDVLFGTRMGADKFAKLKQASKERRGTYGKAAAAAGAEVEAEKENNAVATKASGAAVSSTSAADDLRRRRAAGAEQDVPAETLARRAAVNGSDPTVTTDRAEYAAKAGVEVAASA